MARNTGPGAGAAKGDATAPPSGRMVALLALGCGAIVANLYYAQPLIALVAPAIGLAPREAGLTVTLTQLGYGVGLIFIASLADLVENRALVLACMAGSVIGLLAVAFSDGPVSFLVASFLVGASSVATQILVPLAAHLSPDRIRGRVVGNVMGGLIAGIMLARPVSSFIAALAGWRAVFLVAALFMALLAILFRNRLPRRRPAAGLHYGQILLSMARLLAREPVLRKRALYQALMFAAFNLFWTSVPLLLAHRFGFGQHGIALFALAGAGGAFSAPLAGRLADRGLGEATSAAAMAILAVSFVVAAIAGQTGHVVPLALAAIALDGAVQANQVCGQRAVYALAPELRGRLNAVYIACLFAGGAIGSALSTVLYAAGGWTMAASAGAATGLAALLLFALLGGSSRLARV